MRTDLALFVNIVRIVMLSGFTKSLNYTSLSIYSQLKIEFPQKWNTQGYKLFLFIMFIIKKNIQKIKKIFKIQNKPVKFDNI